MSAHYSYGKRNDLFQKWPAIVEKKKKNESLQFDNFRGMLLFVLLFILEWQETLTRSLKYCFRAAVKRCRCRCFFRSPFVYVVFVYIHEQICYI